MVLMPLSLVFRHGMVWAAVAFLILAVAVIIKNRRPADVFIGIAALDILLGAAAGLWFGVLAAAVQTLVCGFIFRRQIWDKLLLNGHIKSGRDTAFYRIQTRYRKSSERQKKDTYRHKSPLQVRYRRNGRGS